MSNTVVELQHLMEGCLRCSTSIHPSISLKPLDPSHARRPILVERLTSKLFKTSNSLPSPSFSSLRAETFRGIKCRRQVITNLVFFYFSSPFRVCSLPLQTPPVQVRSIFATCTLLVLLCLYLLPSYSLLKNLPMTILLISLVPAPISYNLASLRSLPAGTSLI